MRPHRPFRRAALRATAGALGWLVFGLAGRLAAQTNLIVAADGSGQFRSVQAAIMAVPSGSPTNPVVIHIKPGVYKELIYIQHEKRFFRLVGDDPKTTVLTYDLYAAMPGPDGKPMGTFRTPSTTIDADDFTAENLTFENSAGPVGQALAIRVNGDRVVFRNCRFLGWQDTILLDRGRQYFDKCSIAGSVDFIFGAATAWFQNCRIHCLRNGYVTAASTPFDHPYGFVFSDCGLNGATPETRTYLGRPWRPFASVIFLNTEMSRVVRPAGWFNWSNPANEKTARYAEYRSTGPGADPGARVPWSRQLTPAQAAAITVQRVLGGSDDWNPYALPAAAKSSAAASKQTPAGAAAFKTGIEYGRTGGEVLRLDASVPAGAGPFPVAIVIHGGGWTGGDKQRDLEPILEPLTKTNFTWFSINYRLAPAHRWPACFDDVETAIRWVKAHAAEYKGDPRRLALIGYSAGGQLACLAAARPQPGAAAQAVVALAPPSDLATDAAWRGALGNSLQALLGRRRFDAETQALLRQLSPADHVHPGLPPFLLMQGSADKTVRLQETLNFASKLRANGVSCEVIPIHGAPHRLADWDRFDATFPARMVAWLEARLAQPQPDEPGGAAPAR